MKPPIFIHSHSNYTKLFKKVSNNNINSVETLN